jgi:hypothetical protein
MLPDGREDTSLVLRFERSAPPGKSRRRRWGRLWRSRPSPGQRSSRRASAPNIGELFLDRSGRVADFVDRLEEFIRAHAEMLAPVTNVVIIAHIDFAAVGPRSIHPNIGHDPVHTFFRIERSTTNQTCASRRLGDVAGRSLHRIYPKQPAPSDSGPPSPQHRRPCRPSPGAHRRRPVA